jgi:hypothetical protein
VISEKRVSVYNKEHLKMNRSSNYWMSIRLILASMSQLVKYKIGSNFLGAVVHFCNPSTLEAEAGGLQFQGQHGLHSEKLSQKSKCNLLHCKDNICCKLENTC